MENRDVIVACDFASAEETLRFLDRFGEISDLSDAEQIEDGLLESVADGVVCGLGARVAPDMTDEVASRRGPDGETASGRLVALKSRLPPPGIFGKINELLVLQAVRRRVVYWSWHILFLS